MHEQLLQSLNAVAPLNEEEAQMIREKFKPVSYQKKERILDIEEVLEHYHFINSGLIRMYGYKDGEEKTFFFFKENMLAGSVQSYLHGNPSKIVLETLESTEALKVSKADLNAISLSSPNLVRILLVITQLRLQKLLEFFTSFVLDSPEERYQKFLETEPDLINRVPQHILASFLGITPVSLSRIRKRIFEKR